MGAPTEVEMQEKKLRIEDALSATKAAVLNGIVAGGGTALLKCTPALTTLAENESGDIKLGVQIIQKAIEAPTRQIAKNAHVDDGVVVKTILDNLNINWGYDALNNVYCDMLTCGIIDPSKVTLSAIQSAVSVASTLLSTECLVVSKNTENAN